MENIKEFFKQEFENNSSYQMSFTSFFVRLISSIVIVLVGFCWILSDTEKEKEMRKPSSEYKENHNCKKSRIYITQFCKN